MQLKCNSCQFWKNFCSIFDNEILMTGKQISVALQRNCALCGRRLNHQIEWLQLPIMNPSFVSMASFTVAITFQLLIYCWNGNEVSLYSEKVADAAYDCRWLNASREVKLSLLLIMERAQRRSYLTAGKFSKLSLETFTAVSIRKLINDGLNKCVWFVLDFSWVSIVLYGVTKVPWSWNIRVDNFHCVCPFNRCRFILLVHN